MRLLYYQGKRHKSTFTFTIIFFVLIFSCEPLFAQDNTYPVVRTPAAVNVNRQIPEGTIDPSQMLTAVFSKTPTDEEIFKVHFFEEPLVPIDENVNEAENRALVLALSAYSQRTSEDDFTSLLSFLNKYPDSRWNGSLLANLGIVYRRTGYYSKAMEVWEVSWNLLREQSHRPAKLLADKVVSELLMINAWVGRKEKVDSLLAEISDRIIEGPATERILLMKRSSWLMKNRPEISFMCGPYALNKIFAATNKKKKLSDKLMEVQSTSEGFSLSDLEAMAQRAGMKYQMAFRKAGAELIPYSVVHWKLDHYSALIKKDSTHYKCEDATVGTTYGVSFWLTKAAIDSSASGYFLVPEGILPQGWRRVTSEEGSRIFGKGQVPPDDGKHVSNEDKTTDCPEWRSDNELGYMSNVGMARPAVHLSAVSLYLQDVPVYYTPPVGPAMFFQLNYHQRDSYQPSNFSYSNIGVKWTFNWLSYVQDNPLNTNADADVYLMGGGTRTFTDFNSVTQSYSPELQTNDVLVRVCPGCYELRHPDGSKEVYGRSDGSTSNGRKIFLTKKVDAAGNALNILYDANLRITALKDTLGQITTLSYENNGDPFKITRVTDPFGRYAAFGYDGIGRLTSIRDIIGIVSSFKYDNVDFITHLTTPYGTTGFMKQDGPANYRSVQINYPLGEKEKVVFAEGIDGTEETVVPAGMEVRNNYLWFRNTFYWDKKAMKEGPEDYSKAKLFHWLHGSSGTGENGSSSPILESVKNPLENRVWFMYENQADAIYANQGMSSSPYQIGRVLDDGTTQLSQNSFNSLGADTISIDPAGRKFYYKYDSTLTNLIEIRQIKNNANELLAKFTYNAQRLPLSAIDASGLTSTFTYNAMGQLLTAKNPKNELTVFSYNSNGYLQSITGSVAGSVVSFTYDGFGRVRTVTDPEGYKVTTDYDALNRPTLITYPDSSYEQIVYDKLDAVRHRDRLGRWSYTIYDSLQRPNIISDALGRVTQFIWCSCGSLSEIIDPLKRITTFTRDLQGRLLSKTYPDGKTINYTYESTTSRIKEVTDIKGQKSQYSYFIDDNLKKVVYANAAVFTDSVRYTYDTVYNRMRTMTDGTGLTTYAYKSFNSGPGSGQMQSVDGPLTNDIISYTYDSLGRVLSRNINGIPSSVLYDKLGRIISATNSLGTFAYSYLNQTGRLLSTAYPNGQITSYSYFPNREDQRISEIWNKTSSSATVSKFNYDYNKEGQIVKWTQQAGTATPTYLDLGYDLSDQLISATQKSQGTNAIVKRYAYQYDKAGNRTSEQINNAVTSSVYNNLNQLTAQSGNGPLRFKGSVNEFASVVVKNSTTADSAFAAVDTTNNFEAFVKVAAGVNNISVIATDYSGNNNRAINNYVVTSEAGTNNAITYDANGNTLSSAIGGVTYDWDALDRLVKIMSVSGTTEFVYDGLSRRVAEKFNGTVIKRWLWDGDAVVEERDAAGANVTKRFFAQGEQIGLNKYFFTFDHLGSVREMTDVNGVVQARYDYDPYGRRTKLTGSIDADFGFTGHYYHPSSGLHLALYRAYDATKGRWLNRDPIEESGGLNLYAYVHGNPVIHTDPYGLEENANSLFDEVSDGSEVVEAFLSSLEDYAAKTRLGSNYKLYFENKNTGRVFNGNGAVSTVNIAKKAEKLRKILTPLNLGMGGAKIYNSYTEEGYLGCKTKGEIGALIGGTVYSFAGAVAGGEAGALIGTAIGVTFGGVGAVPGAVIGGVIGAFYGSLKVGQVGENLGKGLAIKYLR